MIEILKLYDVKNLLKGEEHVGALPANKDAYSVFFKLAIPSILELVFGALVNMADTMMVGSCGTAAISAVGLTTQPNLIFMSFFFALNAGTTAYVARRKGDGNKADADEALKQVLVVGFLIGILLSVVSILFSTPLLKFAGAIKGETLELSHDYFVIIQSVLVFKALTLTMNAALRGVGETRTTLVTNVATNIINIFFNYLLIGGNWGFPKLGVKGAAIATAIGVFVGFCIALVVVLRGKTFIKLHLTLRFHFRGDILKVIANIGGNTVIEQVFVRIGFFTVAKLVASLGTVDFAAHQICNQVLALTFNVGEGLSVAATTLVGQNLGKKRPDLSAMYAKMATRVAITASVIIGILLVLGRYFIPSLYDDNPQVINAVAHIMAVVAIAQCAQTTQVIYAGSLRGAGDTRSVAISSAVAIFMLRPILTYIALKILKTGLVGAWIVIPIDQLFRLIFLRHRFATGRWKTITV